MNPPTQSTLTNQKPSEAASLSPFILVMLLVLVVVLVITFLVYSRTGIFGGNQLASAVNADNYILGRPFIVKHAVLTEPGFVVLLAEGPLSENRQLVIEKSTWIPKGIAKNVSLSSEGITGQEEWLTPGLGLFVTLYYDDGDREFQFDKDRIITNPAGDPIGKYILIQ